MSESLNRFSIGCVTVDNGELKNPSIDQYQRHVLLCAGKCCDKNCAKDGDRTLVRYMKSALKSLGIGSDQIRVNRAGCLGVCSVGAIMCVYPEAVWYCGVDQAAVDRIIKEHLLEGVVVTDLLFHRNEFNQSTAGA